MKFTVKSPYSGFEKTYTKTYEKCDVCGGDVYISCTQIEVCVGCNGTNYLYNIL